MVQTISTENKKLDEFLIKQGMTMFNKGKNSVSGDSSSAFVKSYANMAKSAEESANKNKGTDKDLSKLSAEKLKKSARKIIKNAFELDDDKKINTQSVKSVLSKLSEIHQYLYQIDAVAKAVEAKAKKDKDSKDSKSTKIESESPDD